MKKYLSKLISMLLVFTMVVANMNLAQVNFALAFGKGYSSSSILSESPLPVQSATVEPSTAPTLSSAPTVTPEESPTPEVAETPVVVEPTPEVTISPVETPEPSSSVEPMSSAIVFDESMYLTDEILTSLKTLEYDEGQYVVVEDNKNGTSTARIYSEPVRYKDAYGQWKNIENSIVAKDSKALSKGYKNKSNEMEVSISGNIDQTNAVQVSYKGYCIGFRPLGLIREKGKLKAGIQFNTKDKNQNRTDKQYDIQKEYTSVDYTNTYDTGTNINIAPFNNGVKEDIVFSQIPKQTDFSYELNLQNVTPFLREDGNIYFVDMINNVLVAAIPTPYMHDSSTEQLDSADIQVKLEKVGQKYIYTMIPDRKFLEDPTTVYPVTLDPTVTTSGTTSISDTFVSSNHTGTNYNNDAHLRVGYSSTWSTARTLIKINQFPSELAGNHIIQIKYWAYEDYVGSSSPTTRIHKFYSTASWNPATVTWNNQPNFDPTVLASTLVSPAVGWYSWDITSLAQGWYNQTITNTGMLIKHDNESLNMIKSYYSVNSGTNPDYFEFYYATKPETIHLSTSPSGWAQNTTIYWDALTGGNDAVLSDLLYSLDGGTWQSFNSYGSEYADTHNLPEGAHSISMRGVNNYGMWGDPSNTVYYYKDTTRPATPSSVSLSPPSWTNSGILVDYNDPNGDWGGAGVNHFQLSLTSATDGFYWDLPANRIITPGNGSGYIWIRAVDNVGLVGDACRSSNPYYWDDAVPNPPSQPVLANDTSVPLNSCNSGNNDSVKVTVPVVADNPPGRGDCTKYDILVSTDNINFTQWKKGVQSGSQTVTGFNDNVTYYFKIRAYDLTNDQRYVDSSSSYITTLDRTGPVIPTGGITISPTSSSTSYSKITMPTITWSGITDDGNHFSYINYNLDNTGWNLLGSTASGSRSNIPFTEGIHSITFRVYDSVGNYSNDYTPALNYYVDTIAPTASFSAPGSEDVISGNQCVIQAAASDTNIYSWKLDYAKGYGLTEADYNNHIIAQSTNYTALISTDSKTWNLSGFEQNNYYTLRLTVTDKASNTTKVTRKVLYANDANKVDPDSVLTLKDAASNVINANSPIAVDTVNALYSPSANMLGTLYANDVQKDIETAGDRGLTFNALEYDTSAHQWVYPEGSQVFLRTVTKDTSNNLHFTNTTYQLHSIKDSFDNASKVTNLSNVVQSGSFMKLASSNSSGHFQTLDQVINGRVYCVTLNVDETKPGTSNITYKLVYGSRGSDFITLLPNQTKTLDVPMNSCYLQADLSTSDSNIPQLDSWYLDVKYVTFGESLVINNSFVDNARGFCDLYNVVNDIPGDGSNDGCIKLIQIPYPVSSYVLSGSFKSTERVVPGDVWKIFLAVDETKPTGTKIQYFISTDGGQHFSDQPITPGTNPQTDGQWIQIKDLTINNNPSQHMAKGNRIVLKAVLTGDGTTTPALNSWSLRCKQTLAGEAHDIKLIDEPDKLSTLVDANYMTLLRWEPSTTADVTYNIYKSTTPYFDIKNATPVAKDIATNYYNDYNLQFSTTFYYKITAVKKYTIQGNSYERESLPSNEAFATTVSQDELTKKLGLQDYWTYSGFQTGNGTGYVNVASGNVVYKASDMVIPGPFFAMAMTRTFNSLANTKTPMGYGWDYSFNTCLLREYGQVNGILQEKALVLKDGDGTFHEFLKNSTGYDTAKGSFMKLTFNSTSNEYLIERKDGITYHFDAQTMKLANFTDLNGNVLHLEYDQRGNLWKVQNNDGQELIFEYNVVCQLPNQGDYIYTNNHIDMVKTVTWTENVPDNPKKIVYSYEYYDNTDKLKKVSSTIDGTTTTIESYNYDVDLTPDYDNNVVLTDAEGRNTVVKKDIPQNKLYLYDPTLTLQNYSSEHKYTFDFGPDDNLIADKTSVTDDYGIESTYEYDSVDGLLTKRTDAKGNVIQYEYNHQNYLLNYTIYQNKYNGESGTTFIKNKYDYTDDGNIKSVKIYTKAPSTGDYSEYGTGTDYIYDPVFPNKVKTSTVKSTSNHSVTTKYTYDAHGNLDTETIADGSAVSQTTHYSYYALNETGGMPYQLKSVTDHFGKKTVYTYYSTPRDLGRLKDTKEYDKEGTLARTTAAYTYDHYGRTDTVSQPYNSASNGITDMQYDTMGRLELKVNPDNTAEKWIYDRTGRLTNDSTGKMNGSIFESNNKTEYQYDLIGRLKKTIVFNIPDNQNDDSIDQTDYLHWNSDGDPNTGINGEEATLIKKTNPEGTVTLEYYDKIRKLLKTTISNGAAEIKTAEYAYDDIGNMITSKDGAGRISKVYYNELNQKIETVTDPFNASDGQNNLNIDTLYTYDYLGNTLTKTDRAYKSESDQTYTDYETTYVYDDLSRLKNVTQDNPNYGQQAEEPLYLVTSYHYDAWINNYEVTPSEHADLIVNSVTDALGRVNETYFDEMGRKRVELNKGDSTPGEKKTVYSYEGDDGRYLPQMVTRTDHTKVKYAYDVMGRVKSTHYLESGSSTSTEYTENVYDDLGQLKTEHITENSANHDTSYVYDRMGRTLSVWDGVFANGQPDKVEDGLDIEYQYNKVGQVQRINYNTSTGTEHNLVYLYDGYGRPDEIRLDSESNDNNTVLKYYYKSSGEIDYTRDYRKFADLGNNLSEYIQKDIVYNSAGLIQQIKYSDAAMIDTNNTTGTTECYTIGYDGRGQISNERIETDYSKTGDMQTVYKGYQYDALGRLTKASSGSANKGESWSEWDHLTAYTYDDVGNRKSMNDGTNTLLYDYNGYNQIDKVYENNRDTLYEKYVYDARGNQTVDYSAFQNGAATKATLNTYDLENRLMKVETAPVTAYSDSEVALGNRIEVNTNAYNAQGQRVRKYEKVGERETTTKYFYSGDALFYTTDASNLLTTENIIDTSGTIIASKRFTDSSLQEPSEWANQYFFYIYDERGSTTSIIQPDGNAVTNNTYDVYGNITQNNTAGFNNEVTFAGNISDTSTGLVYMNARYYNPKTGTFLSQDTYSGNAYEPWTQHLYSYCGNNPVNMVDPTGNRPLAVKAVDGGGSSKSIVPNAKTKDNSKKNNEKASSTKSSLYDIVNCGILIETVTDTEKVSVGPKDPVFNTPIVTVTAVDRIITTEKIGNPDAYLSASLFERATVNRGWPQMSAGAVLFSNSNSNIRLSLGFNDVSLKVSYGRDIQYGISLGISLNNAGAFGSFSTKKKADSNISNEMIYSVNISGFTAAGASLLETATEGLVGLISGIAQQPQRQPVFR